jgi:hypothetical protein
MSLFHLCLWITGGPIIVILLLASRQPLGSEQPRRLRSLESWPMKLLALALLAALCVQWAGHTKAENDLPPVTTASYEVWVAPAGAITLASKWDKTLRATYTANGHMESTHFGLRHMQLISEGPPRVEVQERTFPRGTFWALWFGNRPACVDRVLCLSPDTLGWIWGVMK